MRRCIDWLDVVEMVLARVGFGGVVDASGVKDGMQNIAGECSAKALHVDSTAKGATLEPPFAANLKRCGGLQNSC